MNSRSFSGVLNPFFSGEWRRALLFLAFSDQRISGLCAPSASTVFFFFFPLSPHVSELSIKCFLVFHSSPVHLVVPA